jgi:hypothetical protein
VPARAGQIVVEMTAGTRTFVTDVEVAKTKLREFGAMGASANAGMVSGTKATTAAVKGLEGQFANNNRAAVAFFTTVLGGGKIAQAAFPIVGGLAFAGMLGTVAEKAGDFFKNLAEAPARARDAFKGITEPLGKANDELQVTNDKLAAEIGKLSGHPGNGLQLALHEAWVVADKLEATVSKTLKELGEVQKKEGIGALNAFFTGRASTVGDQAEVKRFTESMTRIDAEGMARVRATKNEKDAGKAQDEWNKKALDALDLEIEKYEKLSEATRKLQDLYNAPGKIVHGGGFYPVDATVRPAGGEDQSVRMAEQQGTLGALKGLRDRYSLSADEASMQGKLPGLEAADAARKKAEAEQKREREAENRRNKEEQSDWSHLIEERAHVKEEFLSGMEKIDVEEQAEVVRELGKARTMLGEGVSGPVAVDPAKLAYIHETFNEKRAGESEREAKKFWSEIEASITKGLEEDLRRAKAAMERAHSADEHIAGISLTSQREGLNRRAGADEDVAKHSGLSGVDLVNAEYQIRIKLASDLAKIEDARIAKENDADAKRALVAEKEATLAKANDEAEAERDKGMAGLRQKDARDFFEEMRTGAETTGHILYTSLHSALDQASDQLAKLVTGQKVDFGKMLRSLAEDQLKSGMKSIFQSGLGKLGGLFGIKSAVAKPTGRAGDALHVLVDNTAIGGQPSASGSVLGGFSNLAGLMRSGGQALSGFLHSLSSSGSSAESSMGSASSPITYMAEGGSVDPGQSYWVGDGGEKELFTPHAAGTISPLHKMAGTGTATYNIDARGAEIGSEHRIRQAVAQAHDSAVHLGAQAAAERARRSPQRTSQQGKL